MHTQSIPPPGGWGHNFVAATFTLYLFARCRRREHLSFALACGAFTLYDFFTAALYSAASSQASALWARWQMMAMALFCDRHASVRQRLRREPRAAASDSLSWPCFAAFGILAACGDFGLMFLADRPFTRVVKVTVGELTYHEATAGPLFPLYGLTE